MSAYSALFLCADHDLAGVRTASIRSVIAQASILEPSRRKQKFNNLSSEITSLFDDANAKSENDRFFTPDTISISRQISISTPDEPYEAKGFSISIHGSGYFWPWTLRDMRRNITKTSKMVSLRQTLNKQIGGRFVFPKGLQSTLKKRWVDGTDGWMWFAFESY